MRWYYQMVRKERLEIQDHFNNNFSDSSAFESVDEALDSSSSDSDEEFKPHRVLLNAIVVDKFEKVKQVI